jgi:hypothetical protein
LFGSLSYPGVSSGAFFLMLLLPWQHYRQALDKLDEHGKKYLGYEQCLKDIVEVLRQLASVCFVHARCSAGTNTGRSFCCMQASA